MDFVRATVTIRGTAPLSQSHQHGEPFKEGESPDDHDARTWRSKLNTELVDGKLTVVIPPFGMQTALADAARYSGGKIKGEAGKTWTAKFTSGISVVGPLSLGINPKDVQPIIISANVDGRRGGGKRVPRRLPQIPPGWSTTFDVLVLDPIITEDKFRETVEAAGLFIGVGQFRPQKGGTNGRFIVEKIVWQDNRQFVSAKRERLAA